MSSEFSESQRILTLLVPIKVPGTVIRMSTNVISVHSQLRSKEDVLISILQMAKWGSES